MPSPVGILVALEGGDGVGKSTQMRLLATALRARAWEVVETHEPGDCRIGPAVRGIVLDVGTRGLSHRAEALLYAADRAQHVEEVIAPALARAAVVVTDRYTDSSVAYQGVGRGLGADEVAALSRFATGGLVPDLTVVLDLDPAVALARASAAHDRLEGEPLPFHRRVREAFLALAAQAPERYVVVDASRDPAAVAADVLAAAERVVVAVAR